jgi:hypothetical protein
MCIQIYMYKLNMHTLCLSSCGFLCMYINSYLDIYIYINILIYVHIHVYILYSNTYIYIYTYRHLKARNIPSRLAAKFKLCLRFGLIVGSAVVYICIYTYTYIYICVYIYVYIYIYTYVYTIQVIYNSSYIFCLDQ